MTKITTKEFFQGMENLYDENFATTFLVTEDFSQAKTNAQRVWIKNLVDSWRTKIIQESGLLITEAKLDTFDREPKYFMGKFTFVAPGSFNQSIGVLPEIKEGVSNRIKKCLAEKVLKEYPFFPESSLESHKIDFAALVPVYISLGMIGRSEWDFNAKKIKKLQQVSQRKKIESMLSNYEAELLSDVCVLDSNIIDSPVSIKIEFRKVVSKSVISSLLRYLVQNFSECIENFSPELITLNNFPYYIL